MMTNKTIPCGFPAPLGATIMPIKGQKGINFALRAPLATSVTLSLFDKDDNESGMPMLVEGGVWYLWVADLPVGTRYGFRVAGNSTAKQPFNPRKLLLDPYGKAVDGKPQLADNEQYQLFLMANSEDNAAVAPKSVIIDESFDWGDDEFPQTPWEKTIIYELHVKGFTQLHPHVPAQIKGTYAGLASPAVIGYLQDLGITAVELMPVTYGIDEPHLQQKGLSNYWNYNTLSPFSLETDYWSGQSDSTPLSEFKHMVKTLHAAGIEVILDIVFNHTAEAEADHPTYCQRGVANGDFYWLNDDGSTINHSGCGNTVNVRHHATRQWIIDCLCYWVEQCHIDGFRFDLASVLGREPDFNQQARFFHSLAEEPALKGIKFIAEPWDIGDNGYQLGNYPTLFSEWNDCFRDDIRGFFNQHNGQLGRLADRLAGSSGIFKAAAGKKPHNSINYITAHDGFTLADLVAYNNKHNENNQENNQDGHSHNLSNNHGVEGDSDDKSILQARQHSQQAMLAALLLSNGVPMLLAGDELGHSQNGNNNAYCQDNETTWIDWSTADKSLGAYVAQLIRCRRAIPSLQNNSWWSDSNMCWLNSKAQIMQTDDWHDSTSKALQVFLDKRYLLLINGKQQSQCFVLPDCPVNQHWYQQTHKINQQLTVQGPSITLLELQSDPIKTKKEH